MPYASFPSIPSGTYTPTFTGFGTPTAVLFTYAQLGKFLVIQGTFTSGTNTATEARISLPPGYTSSASIPTITGAGTYTGFNANSGSIFTILIETSQTYLTFGIQDSSHAGFTKVTGSGALGAGPAKMSFTAIVPL